jgi:hypothetical protein
MGRPFRVNFWPMLVFPRDGQVLQRVSRPELGEVRAGLVAIAEARCGMNQRPGSSPGRPGR